MCALLIGAVVALSTTADGTLAAGHTSLALGRRTIAGPFIMQLWDRGNGLPQGSVTDIALSSGGFLWLTTFGGLVRFDGAEFRSYGGARTEIGESYVTSQKVVATA